MLHSPTLGKYFLKHSYRKFRIFTVHTGLTEKQYLYPRVQLLFMIACSYVDTTEEAIKWNLRNVQTARFFVQWVSIVI